MKRILILALFPIFTMGFSQSTLEKQVWKEANIYRSENKLPALKWSTELHKAALHHAQYLLEVSQKHPEKYEVTHFETEKTKRVRAIEDFYDRIKFYYNSAIGYANENCLYRPFIEEDDIKTTAQKIIGQWQASPGHNANMLTNEATHVGLAYTILEAPNKDKYIFCVWVAAEFY